LLCFWDMNMCGFCHSKYLKQKVNSHNLNTIGNKIKTAMLDTMESEF